MRLQQWAGGGSATEVGEPVPVEAAPTGVHARPRPFALAVAGEQGREVVVEAEPSATIGDLADALGLDPAGGLEVAGEILDRSRRLTVAGLRQGDVLRPGGPPSPTPAAPSVVELRWVTGSNAGRVDGLAAGEWPIGAGPIADAVVSVATSGAITALDLRTGASRRARGRPPRAERRRGTGVAGRIGRPAAAADGPRMDRARRAIAPPARSEAAGTGAPRSARRPAPPGLAVPRAGRRVTRRWDRARRRPAAGARPHARRPGRRRHARHVRMAAVAVAATTRSRSSCPRCGVGRASGSGRRPRDRARRLVVAPASRPHGGRRSRRREKRRAVGDAGADRRRLGGRHRRGVGGRHPLRLSS